MKTTPISRLAMRPKFTSWFIAGAVISGIFVSSVTFINAQRTEAASFDFSITNAGDKTVAAGSSVSNNVTATLTQGTGATTYVQDSFTGADGTQLSTHTPDVGGAWSFDSCCHDTPLLSNKVQGPVWSGSIMLNNTTLPSADYEVSMDIVWNGPNDGGMYWLGVSGRMNSNSDRYAAIYDMASGLWKLIQRHGGVESTIGSFAQTYVQGQTHNVKLGMVGTAITVYVDGVSRISATDSSVTAVGKPGLISSDVWGGTEMLGDNFLVTGSGGGVPAVTFTLSGLPAGATASFSPASCSPTCTTTATINTLTSTPVGVYPIIVTGTAGTVIHTTSFNLTVNNDITPPTVSLTAPTSGATISGTTAITANASDNVAVAGVQFKLDGSNLGSLDTTSPYAINWDSTTATNGSHTLTAVATDTSNNSTTSTTVSVTVNNGVATPGTCQFLSSSTTAAFCEDLSGGVKSGGRAGDLDDSKWSVGRFVGGSSATNLIAFPPTPVEPCKSGVSSVSSDNDILVCDSSSGHAGQMETAMSAQNYAMLALRPRQAFDFAGRTGTITFNVDAITEGEGSWWPGVYVTDEPTSGAINSSSVIGMMPNNGIGMNFDDNCAVTDASLTKIDNVFLYNNTVETSVPLNNTVCISTKRGFLNHIEIRLSQTSVQIWASDYSTDGVNFPNFRQIGSAAINLPFTRGYVHFEQKERAPIKNEPGFYNLGYTNNYWSNLGFDGPVVTPEVGYAVPDSLTVDPNSANDSDAHIAGAMNVGYGILTNPTSMFSCCTSGGSRTTIGSFSFPSVNLSGVTSAKLTFSVTYTYIAPSFTTSNVALHYSLNGGAMQNPNPQPNYAAEFLCPGCPGSPNGGEGVPYSFPVSLSNLVTGTNTISFAVDNSNNSYPPVVANIDLLTFGGSVTPPPPPPPDTIPPTVSISAPTSGSTVSGSSVAITANASDNVAVAGVQFKLDGNNLGAEDTTSPYTINWDSTTATNGSHTLTAVARDTSNNTTTSTAVSVTVNNVVLPPPTGVWQNISPAGVSTNFSDFGNQNYGFQTIVVDPHTPTTVYVATTYQGLYKSTDSGNSWFRVDTTPNLFSTGRMWCLAIDPFNSNVLYACDGGGIPQGVFKSTDAGVTWTEMMPSNLFQQTTADTYDITTDPYLANHILVTSHSGWNGGSNSGVLESFDGGATWTVHNPGGPWGSGHYVFFMGNSSTWLLATQTDGFWRTTDSGNTWTQVDSTHSMQHGADQLYHSNVNNAWYLGAAGTMLRSTNDGVSWSPTFAITPDGYNSVIGDGINLYSQPANTGVNSTGPKNYITSLESDGTDWTAYNSQTFTDGPMSMAYDPIHNYIYSSNWDAGVWRLATTAPDTTPPSIPTDLSATATSTSQINLSWTASTDDTAVTGYTIFRNGTQINTSTSTNYSDTELTPATTYAYTVSAYDAAGNNSPQSSPASSTTFPDTTPPTVSISSPADGSTVSGTTTITADASDDVGVAGVQFQLDGNNMGSEVTTSPYSISWNTTTTTFGAHALTAIASDSAGNTTTSTAVNVTVVDVTPPTVSISAPANNANVSGSTVTVSAAASDNVGVVGVQFKLDGNNLSAEDTTSPYSIVWDTTTTTFGSHVLTAVARDAAGNMTTSSGITVTVVDVTPPTVNLTAPTNNTNVSGSNVTVSAAASDNVGVVGVQFKLDGANLNAEDTTSPYSIVWNTTTTTFGSHVLTAVARDAAGNMTTSSAVNVTVMDVTPPTVSLTAPANNATVSGTTTTVSATASDNVGVVGVQFKLDGNNLGAEVAIAPYSIVWNTLQTANGSHSLTAVARDAAGNMTTSTARTLKVNNDLTPPTVSISAPVNNTSVIGTITVSATAADNVKVVGVQFQLDGANLGAEDTSSPFSVSWNTTTANNGPHTISAVARDAAGNTATATSITVTVANPVFPQSYTVNLGTYTSGNTASLIANDNNYLVIASTTSGTNRQTNTDFKFLNIAPSSRLDYSVILKSSAGGTTAVVLAFNYTTSAWTQLSSSSISTSEVTINASITSGVASYINAQGNALVEIQSSKNSNHSISDEIVQLTATP